MADIYQTLWDSDENRFSVSERNAQGGWVDENADILLDEQVKASGKRNLDLATRPLFFRVKEDKFALPTYAAFIRLLDNYVANFRETEQETAEERLEINGFLDAVMETKVAQVALDYLKTELGETLTLERFRAVLNRTWFELYTNFFGGKSTHFASGFEHVFVGEAKYDVRFGGQETLGEISGYHSWVKFYFDESRNRVNFLGFKYDLQGNEGADNPDVVTLQMIWNLTDINGNGIAQLFKKKGGFFVGPSPECELVMGAVAFYESVHGRLVQDRRAASINGARYNLVLYRSTTAQGSRGDFIRSFYPEFLGEGGTGGPPVDRPIVVPNPTAGPVAIAAALPNPEGGDEGNEWVELRNGSDAAVDLAGWELRDRSGRPEPLSGTLGAGEVRRFMVSRSGPNTMQLGNKGGAITLHNGSQLVHSVSYANAASGQVFRFVAG